MEQQGKSLATVEEKLVPTGAFRGVDLMLFVGLGRYQPPYYRSFCRKSQGFQGWKQYVN